MKFFTFFNAKGGVGKTTLMLMFASYLAYYKLLKVKVFDLEKPDYRFSTFRKIEIEQLRNPGSSIHFFALKNGLPGPSLIYPIGEIGLTVGEHTPANVGHLVDNLAKLKETDKYDIALLDFPARYSAEVPVHYLAKGHLLDGAYIPHALEPQERRSAHGTALALAKFGVPVRLLWNNVDSDIILRGGFRLDQAERESLAALASYGVEYSPIRIKHFRKASQTVEERCFVRSTLCWPDRYVRMWCPEVITLFEEIVKFLGL